MIPTLENQLPALTRFVHAVHTARSEGEISTPDEFDAACGSFFTDAAMDQIETVVPGWKAMASFANGQTLRHTARAMAAMLDLEEYQTATSRQQRLMEWTLLLHDLAKEPQPGKRDHRHAFRSAARAGLVLHRAGFPVNEGFAAGFDDWYRLTDRAHRSDPVLETEVQDSAKLPAIMDGIDALFGRDAAIVLKSIALHLSVSVVSQWPAPATLSPTEEATYIDSELLPVLGVMVLADSGGWELFDTEMLDAMYEETRAVITRLAHR